MNPLSLLRRLSSGELTPEETDELTRRLSDAYHMDEAAAGSRDVSRIAEKIRARMRETGSDSKTPGFPPETDGSPR